MKKLLAIVFMLGWVGIACADVTLNKVIPQDKVPRIKAAYLNDFPNTETVLNETTNTTEPKYTDNAWVLKQLDKEFTQMVWGRVLNYENMLTQRATNEVINANNDNATQILEYNQ